MIIRFSVTTIKKDSRPKSLFLVGHETEKKKGFQHPIEGYGSLIAIAKETNPAIWSDVARGMFDANDDNIS